MQMNPRAILSVLAVFFALGFAPAYATAERTYGKGEYVIIHDGLAPSKKLSLASHGDGEGGDDNFQVWLMAEPAHRKIAVLADIGSKNNLDTEPDAYDAMWSADSRRVAVSFRRGRHEIQLNIYEIEGGRARLTSGPSLFKDVTSRDVDSQEDVRLSTSGISWTAPGSFKLSERILVKTTDSGFLRGLGKYGKLSSKANGGAFFVEFSAEADCIAVPGHRYRIVDLRVGKFGE